MTSSVYIAGLDPGCGKSTVALGIAELFSHRVGKLGVFRPLVYDEAGPDPIITLLRDWYRMEASYADCYGARWAEASELVAEGRLDELVTTIVGRYRELAASCEAVVVIGSDFAESPVETRLPRELTFNARLATEFGSPALGVVDGRGRDAHAVDAALRTAYHTLTGMGTTVLALIANRANSGVRPGPTPVPTYVIEEVAAIAAPTVAEVAAQLGATRVLGDDEALHRDVLGCLVGAATVPTFAESLGDGHLVVTPGDRADLVVLTIAAHRAGVVSPAGIVLTLGGDARTVGLAEQLDVRLPVLSVTTDSFTTATALGRIEGTVTAANPRKVQAALGAFESGVDTVELAERIDVTRSERMTPLMFEYDLIARARATRRHIVLPEGGDERILRATETLLRRDVVALTLLGDPDVIARRARELGVDIGGAAVLDPASSPLREEFAVAYAKLREHRGMTLELAHDVVTDANYFGTMMVQLGHADGMVSGAAHTTAATIRPAFEIIKTVPGVSVASSVFLMCLADRVLVYGDCAVNPDPDPAQLADIALSSAATAARFGIEPRVAMLSYSTGTSGFGADVEKVAAATELVRSRAPDLPVEGPIQYDAAVDPAVAAAKLPASAVAGHATVFVFPDLNTGNNTYKAVQRSAGAVAIGPVMQGLRKPVNDLSRGATVRDIVNTVAITATQVGT